MPGGFMKLDIKAFTLTSLIIITAVSAILFIWCSINGFAFEVVNLFEILHPSGAFSIGQNLGNPFVSKIPGIIINTLYAAADSFILSFLFAVLYNRLTETGGKKKKKK